jgi:hypothetical protein
MVGYFGGPIEARSGEQLDATVIQPGVHSVAIELDFVRPFRSRGRHLNEARELRLDPLGKCFNCHETALSRGINAIGGWFID